MFPSWFSEAGISDVNLRFLAPDLTRNKLYDWNYTTTAQPGFHSGDQGWNWNDMQKYIQKVRTLRVALPLSLAHAIDAKSPPITKRTRSSLPPPTPNTSGQFAPSSTGSMVLST